jgi:hypothetical protein
MTEGVLCSPPLTPSPLAQLAPGYLLTPFGWAAQPVIKMIMADPRRPPSRELSTASQPAR